MRTGKVQENERVQESETGQETGQETSEGAKDVREKAIFLQEIQRTVDGVQKAWEGTSVAGERERRAVGARRQLDTAVVVEVVFRSGNDWLIGGKSLQTWARSGASPKGYSRNASERKTENGAGKDAREGVRGSFSVETRGIF